MNEVIKQRWVALGPRNYGKSIEWKLEGEPWDTEGLYADNTRGVYLLCLLLEAIQPLGWRLVSSAGKKIGLIIDKFRQPECLKFSDRFVFSARFCFEKCAVFKGEEARQSRSVLDQENVK